MIYHEATLCLRCGHLAVYDKRWRHVIWAWHRPRPGRAFGYEVIL